MQADDLPRLTLSTQVGNAPQLPANVEMPFGTADAMRVPVIWRRVDPRQYESRGTFTVEGRAIGQAAGYVLAEVVVRGSDASRSDNLGGSD